MILPSFDEIFVGRSPELARMEQTLGKARAGSGGMLILAGEAGIGKSRLAAVFATKARAQGACVLWGRCLEGEECPPFGPWTAALRQYSSTVDDTVLRSRMGDGAADIAEILPELRRRFPQLEGPVELSGGDGVQRLQYALFSFLEEISRDAVLVIVLDNLHLADPASLRFLRHFAHELPMRRLVLVSTHRNSRQSSRDPLAMTLEDVSKACACCQLQLEGLSSLEVAEYLARALPVAPSPETAASVGERSGGNPLFLVELTRHLRSMPAGVILPVLPASIKQMIARRLCGLSDVCRQVLSAAAVLGRYFERDAVCRMVDRPSEEMAGAAFEEALDASVISVDPAPTERYRFLHALVQESLLDEVPPPQRSLLHLQAARALQEISGTDPGGRSLEIVSHLLAAGGRANADEVMDWSLRAWEHARRRYACRQAIAIIDRARRALESRGQATDARLALLLFRRGQALTDLQRPEEARESLVRSFDLFLKASNTRGALEVAFTPTWMQSGDSGAGVWLWSGAPGGMPELRDRAFALVSADSSDHARLLSQRGSHSDLRRALAYARQNGIAQLEATSMAHLAYHELLAWRFKECERILAAAVPLAERFEDPALLYSVHYSRYYLGLLTGQPAIASAGLKKLFEDARRTRSQRILVSAHRCAAHFSQCQGRWADARMHAAHALRFLTDTSHLFNHASTLRALLETELQTGHLKPARQHLTQHLTTLDRLKGGAGDVDLRSAPLGARVMGDITRLPPIPQRIEPLETAGPLTLFVATEILEAANLIALHADPLPAPGCLALILRWKGTFLTKSTDGLIARLFSLLGRHEEAGAHFEDALSFCRRAGYEPELAWTCLDYAEALARAGDDSVHPLRLLADGRELAHALKMTPLSRLIELAGTRLTGSARNRPAFPDGLTRREVDVLSLVARGFTNAEIAGRLFISPLTAARHVHNLLDKTGMANRAEAAAYAIRHDVTAG